MRWVFKFLVIALLLPPLFCLILTCSSFTSTEDQGNWTYLFNGKDLEGWEQKGGTGKYYVEDNAIVGETVPDSPNSFLCTKEMFSDFILELEVLVDTSINSGIQFRSNSRPEYRNGRVHGYQADIDPSPRSWSGGIMEEGRRLWIYSLEGNNRAKKAFKKHRWNKYRIEAIGNSIKIWVNNIQTANFIDDWDSSGFIGLQVHAVDVENQPWKNGAKCRFRNIRILTENVDQYITRTGDDAIARGSLVTDLTKKESKEGWKLLFNGDDLTGWEQKGGTARYNVKNKCIVGEAVPDSPNSFLCTESEFGDFILELEVKVDSFLNSGVQFRSHSLPEYRNGRVHGYQAEINPVRTSRSGALFDEARRGWMYIHERLENEGDIFIQGGWNKYRIEAFGHFLKIWVNGVQTTNLIDDRDRAGFIALQVHAIDPVAEPRNIGASVMWRNIRILSENVEMHLNEPWNEVEQKGSLTNALTENERVDGWKLLFDGKTTDGWRRAYKDAFPDRGWHVTEGALNTTESNFEESLFGGDIVTLDEFGDFELYLEFKLAPGANSGIKYFVTEVEGYRNGSAIGFEYSLLDDMAYKHLIEKGRANGMMGSLYDLMPATNKKLRPAGEWNEARIFNKDNHVEHWLNGVKVLEFNRKSEEFRMAVSQSKFKKWDHFGTADAGHILLQDHGDHVYFRSIKIKEL